LCKRLNITRDIKEEAPLGRPRLCESERVNDSTRYTVKGNNRGEGGMERNLIGSMVSIPEKSKNKL